ncbi:hypothetical protein LX36DRAFT_145711 [Colletotrichum falcatum]|nr:hypothetical protein LX36DRAFT_145711 [Colletotrichum falcatum]
MSWPRHLRKGPSWLRSLGALKGLPDGGYLHWCCSCECRVTCVHRGPGFLEKRGGKEGPPMRLTQGFVPCLAIDSTYLHTCIPIWASRGVLPLRSSLLLGGKPKTRRREGQRFRHDRRFPGGEIGGPLADVLVTGAYFKLLLCTSFPIEARPVGKYLCRGERTQVAETRADGEENYVRRKRSGRKGGGNSNREQQSCQSPMFGTQPKCDSPNAVNLIT